MTTAMAVAMAMAILTNGSKNEAVGKSFNAIAFAWQYRLWRSGTGNGWVIHRGQ